MLTSSVLASFFFFFNKCLLLAEMTTKFNNDMYVKMRSKKDEPLSNIRKKTVCIIEKGPFSTPFVSVTPMVSVTETTRTDSPTTSVEDSLLPLKGRACQTRRRRMLILARPSFGMMRVWQWTGLTGSLLSRI